MYWLQPRAGPSVADTKQRTITRYYDQMAPAYARRYDAEDAAGYAFRVRQALALDWLADEPAGNLLDAGCGPAKLAPALLAAGWQVTGLDLSPGMIRQARVTAAGARLLVGDGERLPFASAVFDAAVSLGALEYMDHLAALDELARILRPGGALVLAMANERSFYQRWRDGVHLPVARALRPLVYRIGGRKPPPMVVHTRKTVPAGSTIPALAAAGLTVEASAYYYFQLFPPPLDALLPGFNLAVTRRLEALRGTPLRWLGQGLLLRARKR